MIEHAARESWRFEQPRLRGRVGLERAVVVEVIAREVGQHCGVEAHGCDALLVESVRGHLEAEHRRTVVARFGETAVDGHRIRCGQPRVTQLARTAEADGAEVRAGHAAERSGLRQQVGTGGLAVRAGDADDSQRGRRLAVEAVGDQARVRREFRDRQTDDAVRQLRRDNAFAGFPQHDRCAIGEGLAEVREAVRAATTAGQEGLARSHATAVERQSRDLHLWRRDAEPREQFVEAAARKRIRVVAHDAECSRVHHGSPACTRVVAGMLCRSSGGTASSRSAPDSTFANTGAATSPP